MVRRKTFNSRLYVKKDNLTFAILSTIFCPGLFSLGLFLFLLCKQEYLVNGFAWVGEGITGLFAVSLMLISLVWFFGSWISCLSKKSN